MEKKSKDKEKVDDLQSELEEQVRDIEQREGEEIIDPPLPPGPADFVGKYWLHNVYIIGYGPVDMHSVAELPQLEIFFHFLNPESDPAEFLGDI